MEIDPADVARAKTDAELLAMVEREHHDFTPEALAAAREELTARGLTWGEPVDAPADDAASGTAGSAMMIAGGALVMVALGFLLWRGVSLPSLACLVPGAALLARAMKGQ